MSNGYSCMSFPEQEVTIGDEEQNTQASIKQSLKDFGLKSFLAFVLIHPYLNVSMPRNKNTTQSGLQEVKQHHMKIMNRAKSDSLFRV